MTFNSTTTWGWPAKALHWIGAALILLLLVHGWWMTHLTPRPERLANYAGSIAHWIYPTELRRHRAVWSALMWWLSLLGTIGAAAGVIIGLLRLGRGPAHRGLQRWHHISGMVFAP